jgi:hypothetical protein
VTEDELTKSSMYTEGCNNLRHYSSAVLNARNMAIAQGLVILTAAGYLIRERDFPSSLSVSLFGLFFTSVLYKLQDNYWSHFDVILDAVVALENSGNPNNPPKGTWTAYKVARDKKVDQWLWKFFVATGPFYLLLFAFLVIIAVDLIRIL